MTCTLQELSNLVGGMGCQGRKVGQWGDEWRISVLKGQHIHGGIAQRRGVSPRYLDGVWSRKVFQRT